MSPVVMYNREFEALKGTDTVGDATRRMLEHRVSDLPVVDASGKLLGMFKLDRLLAGLLPAAVARRLRHPRSRVRRRHARRSCAKRCATIDARPVREFAVKPEHVVHPDTAPVEIVLLLYRGANNLPVIDARGRQARRHGVGARRARGAARQGGTLMHGDAGHAAAVIFGWIALWLATALFVITYLVIMSDKLNRAIVALLGAGLLILTGVLNQNEAMAAVDFNTLGLLLGMMLIVNITRRSGLFQYVAIWSAKKVDARPWGILLMMSIVTAVFSAFLDNVTTVLLTVPVTLLITDELKVKPYPYLFAQIIASNIGGTATLIGDPPNIMIGSATGLTFNDFGLALTPVIVVIMVGDDGAALLHLGPPPARDRREPPPRDELQRARDDHRPAAPQAIADRDRAGDRGLHAAAADPDRACDDRRSSAQRCCCCSTTSARPGEDAVEERPRRAVRGRVDHADVLPRPLRPGLRDPEGRTDRHDGRGVCSRRLGGDFNTTALAILWASAVLSAFIDNIPFVATMIPLIKAMAPTFGGEAALLPLWWALSLGACLGGNGTLIGASANLVVAGLAERAGHDVPFRRIPEGRVSADAAVDRDRARLPLSAVSDGMTPTTPWRVASQ